VVPLDAGNFSNGFGPAHIIPITSSIPALQAAHHLPSRLTPVMNQRLLRPGGQDLAVVTPDLVRNLQDASGSGEETINQRAIEPGVSIGAMRGRGPFKFTMHVDMSRCFAVGVVDIHIGVMPDAGFGKSEPVPAAAAQELQHQALVQCGLQIVGASRISSFAIEHQVLMELRITQAALHYPLLPAGDGPFHALLIQRPGGLLH